MFAGQHNQIYATTPCTAWARAAHVFFTFGPPPSIFLSERKSVFTPKRFCRICFSRNESHAQRSRESTGWYGYCFVSYALSAGNVRPGTQASSAVQRYRLWNRRPASAYSSLRLPRHLFYSQLGTLRLLDGRCTRKRFARLTSCVRSLNAS